MITASRLALSAFCIFGAIVFSNTINDVDASLLSSATIALLFQFILAIIGAIAYFISMKLGIFKPSEEISVQQIEDEEGFEITDVNSDNSKIIGVFGGTNIYDKVIVSFQNGFKTEYVYNNTIKFENEENLDVSNLTPGSLILGPGIVYVPIK